MSKIITLKCRCGAHIEVTETELIELETAECMQCGSDNIIDGLPIVQIDEPMVATDFDDDRQELDFN